MDIVSLDTDLKSTNEEVCLRLLFDTGYKYIILGYSIYYSL